MKLPNTYVITGIIEDHVVDDPEYKGPLMHRRDVEALKNLAPGAPVCIDHNEEVPVVIGKVRKVYEWEKNKDFILAEMEINMKSKMGQYTAEMLAKKRENELVGLSIQAFAPYYPNNIDRHPFSRVVEISILNNPEVLNGYIWKYEEDGHVFVSEKMDKLLGAGLANKRNPNSHFHVKYSRDHKITNSFFGSRTKMENTSNNVVSQETQAPKYVPTEEAAAKELGISTDHVRQLLAKEKAEQDRIGKAMELYMEGPQNKGGGIKEWVFEQAKSDPGILADMSEVDFPAIAANVKGADKLFHVMHGAISQNRKLLDEIYQMKKAEEARMKEVGKPVPISQRPIPTNENAVAADTVNHAKRPKMDAVFKQKQMMDWFNLTEVEPPKAALATPAASFFQKSDGAPNLEFFNQSVIQSAYTEASLKQVNAEANAEQAKAAASAAPSGTVA